MQTWAEELREQGAREGEARGARKATEQAVRTVLVSRFGLLSVEIDARLKRAKLERSRSTS